MKKLIALVLTCLCAFAAPAHQQEGGALGTATVISRVRSAIGADQLEAQKHGFTFTGVVRHAGLDAKFEVAVAPDGRFAVRIHGPLGECNVYDGTVAVSRDWSGITHPLEFEALELLQMDWWIIAGRWLAPDSPFTSAVDTKRSDEKRIAVRISLGQPPLEAVLFVDRDTWRPVLLMRRSGRGEEVHQFGDYHTIDGVTFPFRISQTIEGVDDIFQGRVLKAASATEARAAYAITRDPPNDTKFDASIEPDVQIERTRSGHTLIRPLIDGKDVGWFLLDSGAGGMFIDRRIADTLEMPVLGEVRVLGLGSVESSRFRPGKEFKLGPITISSLKYIEVSLDSLTRSFGVPIAGIVGYDLLARAVVELDVSAPVLRFHDPALFRLDRGKWQALRFSHKHPVISARFEGGREGLFMLDTGSDDALVFHAPAVNRFNLLERRETEVLRSNGVAGSLASRVGKINGFELAGRRFEPLRACFESSDEGSASDAYVVGDIGSAVLRHYLMVFDYRNQRMAFIERPRA